jgi:hypothetical protein
MSSKQNTRKFISQIPPPFVFDGGLRKLEKNQIILNILTEA